MAMVFINEIAVTGIITKKPELRFFTNASGKEVSVTTIRIGFREKRNSSKSCFINVEVFGQKAIRICEKCDKGSLVYVKGSFRKRKYTNKEGETRYNADILCETIRFAEGLFINNVELTGYVTKKPFFKDITFKNGEKSSLASVSIGFKDKRNYNESYFVDTVIFGEASKRFYDMVDKGTPVYIKGNIHNNSYTTRDGQKRNVLELIIEEFQVMRVNKNKDNRQKEEISLAENKNNNDIILDNKNGKNEFNVSLDDDSVYGFSFVDDEDIPF